jgi:hypothetical protein
VNLQNISKAIFLTVACIAIFAIKFAFGQDTIKPKQIIKERLPVHFGTLAKLKVEVVDGDSLDDKYHEGDFLFKVKCVDSISLTKAIIIEFKDETGRFKIINKKNVGQEFTIVAYETGEFSGIPDGYFKYQPVRQDYGFHFRHYLIVVAVLTKTQ